MIIIDFSINYSQFFNNSLGKKLLINKENVFIKWLNMFLVLINIPTFRSSFSKIFLQLLIPQKKSIFTFSPYFKVNSYVKFIF